MKKLDKLVLRSFLGPFILTTLVVVFILLLQSMMKFFDEMVGKNLDLEVFAEMFMYFAVGLTPMALPLAVLLSSLMTFGNLGENFELTAIKSAGISLLRVMRPIFVFVALLSAVAWYSNMYIVPNANLKAYRILYDIKKTKPALSIKEGSFYNGLPGYSIKAAEKEKDGLLRDLLIYDHSDGKGNTNVMMADSGRMYTFNNDRYMMLELYSGSRYSEETTTGKRSDDEQFVRYKFDQSEMVFSMEAFDMKETDEKHFSKHRFVRTYDQLVSDVDSVYSDLVDTRVRGYRNISRYHTYHLRDKIKVPQEWLTMDEYFEEQKQLRDSLKNLNKKQPQALNAADTTTQGVEKKLVHSPEPLGAKNIELTKNGEVLQKRQEFDGERIAEVKSGQDVEPWENWSEESIATLRKKLSETASHKKAVDNSLDAVKYPKGNLRVRASKEERYHQQRNKFANEKNKKLALAVSCLIMFLIGAPLGSIIKKGGLGVPVLISIIFFILFYVILTKGEKWSIYGVMEPFTGVWLANFILLPIGFFFLRQASKDARILEADFYNVIITNFKRKFSKRKK